jgi:hypothetical protein
MERCEEDRVGELALPVGAELHVRQLPTLRPSRSSLM